MAVLLYVDGVLSKNNVVIKDGLGLYRTLKEKMAVIFRGDVFKTMTKNPSSAIIADRFGRPTNNPPLMQTNPIEINEFLNKTLYAHNNNIGVLTRAKKLLIAAEDLEKILNEHYHIKE